MVGMHTIHITVHETIYYYYYNYGIFIMVYFGVLGAFTDVWEALTHGIKEVRVRHVCVKGVALHTLHIYLTLRAGL